MRSAVRPDIILRLAERAETRGYRFYLYGGAPEVLERMKQKSAQPLSLAAYRWRALATVPPSVRGGGQGDLRRDQRTRP